MILKSKVDFCRYGGRILTVLLTLIGVYMNCRYCHNDIDSDRLEFLTEYNRPLVCIECSTEQKAVGFLSYSHKTAPELVMIPANNKESIRRCDRVNRRAR